VTVRQIAPTQSAKAPDAKRPRGRPRRDGLVSGSAEARQADERKRADRQKPDRQKRADDRRRQEKDETITVYPVAPTRRSHTGLLNVDDVCRYLGGVSKPMVYRLIGTGKLLPVKIGQRSMFTKEELDRYIEECQL
jgi:excisionase family DNA binding protein